MNCSAQKDAKCLICLNDEFDRYRDRDCTNQYAPCLKEGRRYRYNCSICGTYEVSGLAYYQFPKNLYIYGRRIRAGISHKFKVNTRQRKENRINGNGELYYHFQNTKIPRVPYQLWATIKFIGDSREITGVPLPRLPVDFHSIVGTLNRDAAFSIVKQLIKENYIDCENVNAESIEGLGGYYLTIKGLEAYQNGNLSRSFSQHQFENKKVDSFELLPA